MKTITVTRAGNQITLTRCGNVNKITVQVNDRAKVRTWDGFLAERGGEECIGLNGSGAVVRFAHDIEAFVSAWKADIEAHSLCASIRDMIGVEWEQAKQFARIAAQTSSAERVPLLRKTQLVRSGDEYEQMTEVEYYAQGGRVLREIVSEYH